MKKNYISFVLAGVVLLTSMPVSAVEVIEKESPPTEIEMEKETLPQEKNSSFATEVPIESTKILEKEVVEPVEKVESVEIQPSNLMEEDSIQTLANNSSSIYGKKLIEIVPDRRLAQGLLSKAFPGKSIDDFVVTEDNIGAFTQLSYAEDRSSSNETTVNFEGIQYFKNLKVITINFINIDKFPEQILELEDLSSLTMTGVIQKPRISSSTIEIPQGITKLTNLKTINFNNNMVKELPDFLSEMTQLVNLNFTGSNYYHDSEFVVPESYINLVNLTHLSLSNNHMKYLPDNLHQYNSLSDFRFVYNNLLEISNENYEYLGTKLNRIYTGDQFYQLTRELPYNIGEEEGFLEVDFPQFVSFMSDLNNKSSNGEDLIFRLYSSDDEYETSEFIQNFGKLEDSDGDGVFSTSSGLKYDSNTGKVFLSNKFFYSPSVAKDDFRLTAKMYDGLFGGSYYSYDFTTVSNVNYETEYIANLDLAPGEEQIVQAGVLGTKNTEGVVKPPINEIIEYGPENIPFEIIRKKNPNLAKGEERVISEGVEGRIDRDGKVLVEVKNKVVEFGTATNTSRPWKDEETDKKDDKTSESIEVQDHIQYIQGYPDGSVHPDGQITRAEAATMLARLLRLNLDDTSSIDFKDGTNEDAWYNKYVNAIVKNGYMKGYPDGSFGAEKDVSRAELAKMIQSIGEKNVSEAPFLDIKDHWAQEAINQSYGSHHIDGYPDGSFKPDQAITRAETAKILDHLFNRKVDAEGFTTIKSGHIHDFNDLSTSHWGYYEIIEASDSHDFSLGKDEKTENWSAVTHKTWSDIYKK